MDYVPAKVPRVGEVLGTILQMSTFGVLCFCLSMFIAVLIVLQITDHGIARRTQMIKKWMSLPLAQWRKSFPSLGILVQETKKKQSF
jgi:hypothetical protein